MLADRAVASVASENVDQSTPDAGLPPCPIDPLRTNFPPRPTAGGRSAAESTQNTVTRVSLLPLLTPNYTNRKLSSVMETVNALELRQSLGKVLDRLERDGAPIVVCRRRTPAAALVSLKDYRERFVDREADQRRRDIVARLKQLKFEPPTAGTTLDMLRDLRS